MPKKPCQFCDELLPSGWSNHRCPELDAAMRDLREAAGVEDEPEQSDGQDDSSECQHPADGVMWNEFNGVTQCHRCGAQIDGSDRGN